MHALCEAVRCGRAVGLLVRAVREDHQPTTAPARREPVASPAVLPPRLRALIAALTVFSLVNFPDALLLLRAHELGLSTPGVIAASRASS